MDFDRPDRKRPDRNQSDRGRRRNSRNRDKGRQDRRKRRKRQLLIRMIIIALGLLLVITSLSLAFCGRNSNGDSQDGLEQLEEQENQEEPNEEEQPEEGEEPEYTYETKVRLHNPGPWNYFWPYSLPHTRPGASMGFESSTQIQGTLGRVHFGLPEDYTEVVGITTFRGNNFRNQAAWGTANIVEERLEIAFDFEIGQLGAWTGVGWTGQPAIVSWDFQVQQIMNIFPEKQMDRDLVEAIYGAMDGYIYFFDIANGEPTREPIYLGQPIKGAVTIDPRGYPLLYVGQGATFQEGVEGYGRYAGPGEKGFFIYSLIDGSQLYFLDGYDPFAPRDYWHAFDGDPLFDTEIDRMILPGENGVIYNFLLNTDFDMQEGTISIDPVISRYRFTTNPHRPYGVENSPVGFSHYIFFADNSGIIQCLDMRTMEPVWVFDGRDDINATMVLDWEEDQQRLVLYAGTSVDIQGEGGRGYIYKLNAANGEVLWYHYYYCLYFPGVNGGVMATPVLGKEDISNLVIFPVARTLDVEGDGVLVAFDRETGEIVWETIMPHYMWSSPVAVYTPDGTSYIVSFDSAGSMYLLRGTTGEILYQSSVWVNVEASPAVFGNRIIIGSRGNRIFGIDIL